MPDHDAAQLASILRGAPDAFVAMDTDGRVVSWNDAATDLFGWTEDEARGREVTDLIVPPEHAQAHAEGVRRLTDPRSSHVLGRALELEARHRDGYAIEIEMTISAVAHGDGHLFTAFSRDISARKAVERALERERRFTEAVLETIDTAIVACDEDGRLTLRNRAARQLDDDAHGPLVRVLDGERLRDAELRSGDRTLSTSGVQVVDRDGRRLGAVVAMHDVTAREEDRRRAERDAEDLVVLAALTRQLSSSGDVAEAATLLVAAARERTGAAAACLSEPGPEGGLVVTHASGDPQAAADGAERAWRRQVPVADRTAWHQPVRGEAVLTVCRPQSDREHLGRLMPVLADHAAGALARAQLLADLGQLATTDELTQLPNRRAWERALGRAHSQSRRHGTSFAVAVLDLDHFKAYNDRHGHVAGDALLRDAARAWAAELRPSDVLARWGGEEFALLLPYTGTADARDVLERLRRLVPGGQTCSAGLVVGTAGDDPSVLVGRADDALYEAKACGRDRVVVWEAEPSPSA